MRAAPFARGSQHPQGSAMIDDDSLSDDERALLERLPKEIQPSPVLEERVVTELRASGLLRTRRWTRLTGLAAAAVVIFAAGVVAARLLPISTDSSNSDRYLLLLYGAASATAAEEQTRVAEYSDWAHRESSAGRLLEGEKLDDAAIVLGASGVAAEQPLGFFMIRAQSSDEAQATAARCPHLRHGGTVVIKHRDGSLKARLLRPLEDPEAALETLIVSEVQVKGHESTC